MKHYSFLFLLYSISASSPFPKNITLSQLQSYIKTNIEFPTLDSTHQIHYINFYRNKTPSMFRKLFGLDARNQILDILENTVGPIVKKRELSGFGYDSIQKITPASDAQLVIWGNIQGALHSLVRGLDYLQGQGILNNELKIINPLYYFIFDANVIVRSPYLVETLLVVITLMKNNPDRVFYIQDMSEYQNNWHTDWLMEQLKIFANNDNSYLNDTLVPLLNRFFATLPYALYIGFENDKEAWIRVAGTPEVLGVNEEYIDNFFTEPFSLYHIKNKVASKKPVTFKAFLNAGILNNYYQTTGLTQLDYEKGITTWGLFSSPTTYNQLYNKMFNDAFVIMRMNPHPEKTTITLYNRDVRKSYPNFRARETYYIASGFKLDPFRNYQEYEPKQYIFGSTLDLSKSNAIMGMRVRSGISSALMEHNVFAGEKQHDTFRIIVVDDEYTPYKARKNIDMLREQQHIDTFLLPVGSPTFHASLDLIKNNEILVLFPITGAPEFRTENLPGVVHLRASYRNEVFALIPYLMDTYETKRFLFFYQDDVYGKGPLAAARELLPLMGIKEWKEVPYNRNTTDFKHVVQQIKEFQPDALGLFSTSAPTKEMLRQVGIENLVNAKLFGISFLIDDSFTRFAKSLGLPSVFSNVVPNPATSKLPIVEHYRRLMNQNSLMYNVYSLEGYIGTRLLIDAVKEIDTIEKVDHSTLLKKLESIKDLDFLGLPLNFNPKTRELSTTVWLDTGNEEWIEVKNAEHTWKEKLNLANVIPEPQEDKTWVHSN